MKSQKVLSLDVSTKTGYASIISEDTGMTLEDYGTLPQIHKPEGDYPGVYIDWSLLCFNEIKELIERFKPDVLVVEETSKGSKNAMSQKILEFIHFLLAKYIKDSNTESVYIMTEQWRREIGCQMSKEEKLRNKEVRNYKKKNKTIIAYDINGKRTGLIGRKHVNIRRVSEIFAGQLKQVLKRKDEDLADGLGLAACYHLRRLKINRSEEVSMEDIVGDKT
jgi:Holliday junction resolvasome RuvABC endonuclease subunit